MEQWVGLVTQGMWNLFSQPGIEPESPALGGRFLTIGLPRKYLMENFLICLSEESCSMENYLFEREVLRVRQGKREVDKISWISFPRSTKMYGHQSESLLW